MNKRIYIPAALALAVAGALGMSGCDSTSTAVTAAICTDAATLKASTIALNAPETTALNRWRNGLQQRDDRSGAHQRRHSAPIERLAE